MLTRNFTTTSADLTGSNEQVGKGCRTIRGQRSSASPIRERGLVVRKIKEGIPTWMSQTTTAGKVWNACRLERTTSQEITALTKTNKSWKIVCNKVYLTTHLLYLRNELLQITVTLVAASMATASLSRNRYRDKSSSSLCSPGWMSVTSQHRAIWIRA